MLGFLSHTNTIQIHLYSYYVLRITNTNTIRVHSSGIQIHQSINWSINQLVQTQYNHSLQIISIKFIHSHLTQNKKKQMMAQTWLSRLALSACLFFCRVFVLKQKNKQTSMIDQWSTCFHDQKSLVGLENEESICFPQLVSCGFIAQFFVVFLFTRNRDQKVCLWFCGIFDC